MDHKLHFYGTMPFDLDVSSILISVSRASTFPQDIVLQMRFEVRKERTVSHKQAAWNNGMVHAKSWKNEKFRCSFRPNVESDWLICGSCLNVQTFLSGQSSDHHVYKKQLYLKGNNLSDSALTFRERLEILKNTNVFNCSSCSDSLTKYTGEKITQIYNSKYSYFYIVILLEHKHPLRISECFYTYLVWCTPTELFLSFISFGLVCTLHLDSGAHQK